MTPEAPGTPPAGVSARPTRLTLIGLGVVVALLGAWYLLTGIQIGQVRVAWSSPVECGQERVVDAQVGMDHEIPVQAMRLVPEMECTIRVRVTNEGPTTVTVTRVMLPFMGPGGGAAVQVPELDGVEPGRDRRDPPALDANFAMEVEIGPGSVYEFVMEFVFRDKGCTAAGLMWVEGMPTVSVSSWRHTGDRIGDDVVAFRGTRESNCRGGRL